MPEPRSYTSLSLALLDKIVICGQCGALMLGIGWSNETHLAWHDQQRGPGDAQVES